MSNPYPWEKDLRNPPLTGESSRKEWMAAIEQRISNRKRRFRPLIPLMTSILIIALTAGVFLTYTDAGSRLLANWHADVPSSQSTYVAESIVIPSMPSEDVVDYPPHNLVFENQDQLPEADQVKAVFIQDMAYAYQNIKTLKGSAEINRDNAISTVEFQIREGKHPASYVKSVGVNGTRIVESTMDGSYYWQRVNDLPERVSRVSARDLENEPRQTFVSTAPDGLPSYYFPSDPSFSSAAEDIVAPLRNIPWLTMFNDWSLKGVESLLGFKVNVIEGKLPAYIVRSMHADTYKVWVEEKTHMMLKKQFYDAKGNIVESYEVTSLELNAAIDDRIFDIPQDKKP